MDTHLHPHPNAEAIEAWDGPLFIRFSQYRHIVTDGLRAHGDVALRQYRPRPGSRVIDIGCGFGDTTQQLAALVGPTGSVVGVDAASQFIATARREARAAGFPNVRFETADVQTAAIESQFDLAFSRFGTMFFANPVLALRNLRGCLTPGGRLVMVVWRAKVENEWLARAERITERFVSRPDESDEPTCGPGPFSMASAETTIGILASAGFEDISLRRHDAPILIGTDLEEAVQFALSLGPAGEILRLAGPPAAHLHEPIADALRHGFSEWVGPTGVVAPASSWTVSAIAPSAGASGPPHH